MAQNTQLDPYKCECGTTHSSRFCPNCGSRRKEPETFTCECGYSGPKSNFCPECGKAINAQVSSPAIPPESAEPSDPEEKTGWKCPACGAENQEGKCNVCGKEIEPVILFSLYTFTSSNPPSSSNIIIYEYSDTKLLMDNNGKRRLIPADVIGPAMEIIRKNRLDDPDFTDPSAMAIMGGAVNVTFKDGDKYIQTSLQKQGFAVMSAQGQLTELFLNA